MNPKHQLLITLLINSQGKKVTVTRIRDQLLAMHGDSLGSASTLRRWIAGKFVTFTRKGWLERIEENRLRSSFITLPRFYQDNTKPIGQNDPDRQAELVKTNINGTSALNQLEKELLRCKRTIISQFGEIEEYQRIKQTYPTLSAIVSQNFNTAMEENYKLLGKAKAFEAILTLQSKEGARSICAPGSTNASKTHWQPSMPAAQISWRLLPLALVQPPWHRCWAGVYLMPVALI